MNFEDYVNQIAKKCQLATATAVLKNKPTHLSTDEYIAQLREKINANADVNLVCSDDFDIHENDFDFDDGNDLNSNLDDTTSDINVTVTIDTTYDRSDEQTNLTYTNNEQMEETAIIDLLQHYNVVREVDKSNDVATNKTAPSSSNFESLDFLQQYKVIKNGNGSKEISTNVNEPLTSKHKSPDSNSLNEVLKTLRHIDENKYVDEDQLINNFTQDMFDENSQITISIDNDPDEENMDMHNQPFRNLNIITEVREDDFVIDERLKLKIAKNIARTERYNIEKEKFNTNESFLEFDMEIPANVIESSSNEKQETNKDFVDKKTAIVKNIEREIVNKQENNNNYNIFNSQSTKENNTQTNAANNLADDTQKTIVYTLHGYTEKTQISQSQYQNIEISDKFIFGNKIKSNGLDNYNKSVECDTKNEYDTTEDRVKNKNKQLLTIDSTQIQYIIDNDGKTYAVLGSIAVSDNHNAATIQNADTHKEHEISSARESNFDNLSAAVKKKGLDVETNATAEILDTQKDCDNLNNQNLDSNTAVKNNALEFGTNITAVLDTQRDFNPEHTEDQNNTYADDNLITDTQNQDIEMSSQETAVPFKVVKELSKIKSYLNRRESIDGFSSDSGYKSDSQSSFMSGHLSENWMHQSAYCLYHFIVQCPLVAVTQEIVTEISQVLGRLIDKLHDEEKYPNFVEELLEKIDHLLRELYEGDSSCDDVLLQKDELIQRLLLLNKSAHILKFTIDKITVILEQSHRQLISEVTLHELSNVGETENLCYLFNLLENLIQKFVKVKNCSNSQSTQSSQETKILRKSSISEIWRKKWNPNFKGIKNAGSQEKGCCLDKCGVVLNKMIVECMEGYSLVSFAALQCFNLLQNQ